MQKKFQPQTDFLIENFVFDLCDHFNDCKENTLYLVNLMREKIYRVENDGKEVPVLMRPEVKTKIFTNLHNPRESYGQLVNPAEVIGFSMENIHILPTCEKSDCLIKFKRGQTFDYAGGKKIHTYLLSAEEEKESLNF